MSVTVAAPVQVHAPEDPVHPPPELESTGAAGASTNPSSRCATWPCPDRQAAAIKATMNGFIKSTPVRR